MNTMPADLPEVRKILADKGSSRPYYADAKEQIGKIQKQISNGCKERYRTNPFDCVTAWVKLNVLLVFITKL